MGKIADFGISKILVNQKEPVTTNGLKKKQMKTTVGTISYTAPEVLLKKRYDYTVDFWSIGVIMFILLCGYPPFYGDDDHQVTKSLANDELTLDEDDWDHVSIEAKNLVKGLLSKDPSKRKSCEDILKLAWKVSSKSLSFAKARNNFKKTVIKRKLHRASMPILKDPLFGANRFKSEKNNKMSSEPMYSNKNMKKKYLDGNQEKKENHHDQQRSF